MLWSHRVLYPLDYSYNTRVVWEGLDSDRIEVEPILDGVLKNLGLLNPYPGRLTCTLSGAGKRRIFAVGKCVNGSYILCIVGQCGSYLVFPLMEPSIKKVHSTVLAALSHWMFYPSTSQLQQIGGRLQS